MLILWNRTERKHFLLHLEVRRVILLSHDEISSHVSSRRPKPSCALGGPPPSLDSGLSIQGEERLDIGNRSDIGFTPFRVNSLKFSCLPHLAKYLFPLILCRVQVW